MKFEILSRQLTRHARRELQPPGYPLRGASSQVEARQGWDSQARRVFHLVARSVYGRAALVSVLPDYYANFHQRHSGALKRSTANQSWRTFLHDTQECG